MNIVIVGSDPAGLYLGSLIRQRSPQADVAIIETGHPVRTGLPPHVLTNTVRPTFALADEAAAAAIAARRQSTRGLVISRDGERLVASGHATTVIAPDALAGIMRARAQVAGCRFKTSTAMSADMLAGADIVVIADGAESPLRSAVPGFAPQVARGRTRLAVCETDRSPAQSGIFLRRLPEGVVHAFHMPREEGRGALVVEALAETLDALGTDIDTPETLAARVAAWFGSDLDGANVTVCGGWRPHAIVANATWTSGACVLLGAAAYTADPSIGLGARSGLEDAEALATCLTSGGSAAEALARFEAARRPRAESLQRASAASRGWFDHAGRYVDMAMPQLAYSVVTRSLRINHESMRAIAPEITDAVEALIAGSVRTRANRAPPPMFTPITLRGLTIPNRIAMSPMCMYNAVDQDGTVGDFHLVHYGSRAVGGAGLIITEMTDVSPEGRISAHCAGMYKPEHVAAWQRVTSFIHDKTPAKIGVQLGHAGRKGGELRPWDKPVSRQPQWQTIAPSPIPFQKDGVPPREMTRADMDRLIAAYSKATRMSHEAGFDFVELHFAHGYLLSTFISPLTNQRTDQYGGSLANRLRFPMEVFEAVREAWPADKPTCVRISAYDWMAGGTTIEDAIEVGRVLRDAGNDILSVSTGGVVGIRPPTARLYQARFSDAIRNELKITTMNVGAMASHGDINAMIAAGRADMCALARGHLFDPYFTRHAAFQQDYQDLDWPNEYERAPTLKMRDF